MSFFYLFKRSWRERKKKSDHFPLINPWVNINDISPWFLYLAIAECSLNISLNMALLFMRPKIIWWFWCHTEVNSAGETSTIFFSFMYPPLPMPIRFLKFLVIIINYASCEMERLAWFLKRRLNFNTVRKKRCCFDSYNEPICYVRQMERK